MDATLRRIEDHIGERVPATGERKWAARFAGVFAEKLTCKELVELTFLVVLPRRHSLVWVSLPLRCDDGLERTCCRFLWRTRFTDSDFRYRRGRVAKLDYATAHSADNTSACSNTVCVAFSCLSGGVAVLAQDAYDAGLKSDWSEDFGGGNEASLVASSCPFSSDPNDDIRDPPCAVGC